MTIEFSKENIFFRTCLFSEISDQNLEVQYLIVIGFKKRTKKHQSNLLVEKRQIRLNAG